MLYRTCLTQGEIVVIYSGTYGENRVQKGIFGHERKNTVRTEKSA